MFSVNVGVSSQHGITFGVCNKLLENLPVVYQTLLRSTRPSNRFYILSFSLPLYIHYWQTVGKKMCTLCYCMCYTEWCHVSPFFHFHIGSLTNCTNGSHVSVSVSRDRTTHTWQWTETWQRDNCDVRGHLSRRAQRRCSWLNRSVFWLLLREFLGSFVQSQITEWIFKAAESPAMTQCQIEELHLPLIEVEGEDCSFTVESE